MASRLKRPSAPPAQPKGRLREEPEKPERDRQGHRDAALRALAFSVVTDTPAGQTNSKERLLALFAELAAARRMPPTAPATPTAGSTARQTSLGVIQPARTATPRGIRPAPARTDVLGLHPPNHPTNPAGCLRRPPCPVGRQTMFSI